tara:strand:+ start:19 stop:804 length:786 start_codon:yes stop_codon:yes gene_type:complete
MRSLYGAIVNTNKKEIMVSVDAVYQKVLAIANKEQRGYITPQEFNLFADHAQKEIFRQYFHDLDQFKRRPGNDYADVAGLIEEKISRFEVYNKQVGIDDGMVDLGIYDLYKLTMVTVEDVIAEKTSHKEAYSSYALSPLIHNSLTNGFCARYVLGEDNNSNILKVWPPTKTLANGTIITDVVVRISYVRMPSPPNWTYVIVNESAMLDDNIPGFKNFQVHESEETLLVVKILQLAGINIKDASLVQLASQAEVKTIQQEKQ